MLRLLLTLTTITTAFAAGTINSADNTVDWTCPTDVSDLTYQINACANTDTAGRTLGQAITYVTYSNAPTSYVSDYHGTDDDRTLFCGYYSEEDGDICIYNGGAGQPVTFCPDCIDTSQPNDCPAAGLTPTGGFTRRNMKSRDTTLIPLIYRCPQLTTVGGTVNFLNREFAAKDESTDATSDPYSCSYTFDSTLSFTCEYTTDGTLLNVYDNDGPVEDSTTTHCPITLCNANPTRKRTAGTDVVIAERQFSPKKKGVSKLNLPVLGHGTGEGFDGFTFDGVPVTEYLRNHTISA